MKLAKFNELKYGDKLVYIDSMGNCTWYIYLCPEPGFKEQYAFLELSDGEAARHFYKSYIEKMYVYEDTNEVSEFINTIRAEYYKKWLDKYYESQKQTQK